MRLCLQSLLTVIIKCVLCLICLKLHLIQMNMELHGVLIPCQKQLHSLIKKCPLFMLEIQHYTKNLVRIIKTQQEWCYLQAVCRLCTSYLMKYAIFIIVTIAFAACLMTVLALYTFGKSHELKTFLQGRYQAAVIDVDLETINDLRQDSNIEMVGTEALVDSFRVDDYTLNVCIMCLGQWQ